MTWTRGRKIAASVGAAIVLLIALCAAFFPRIVGWIVVREARSRGIELEVGSLSVDWTSVRLADVRFRLVDATVVRGSARSFVVAHVLLSPRSLEGEGVDVALDGTSARELSAWAARFPDAFALPATMSVTKIEWRPQAPSGPVVTIAGGALEVGPEGGKLRGAGLGSGPVRLGLDAAWRLSATALDVGVFSTALESAPLRATVVPEPGVDRVKVELERGALEAVKPILLLERLAPPGAMEVEGKLELVVSRTPGAPIDGTAELRLFGWVPPHPKELDGIVFGNVTSVDASLRLPGSTAQSMLDVPKLRLKAGALDLSGRASLEARERGPTIVAQLGGQMPCSELAVSAIAAHFPALGTGLGSKLVRNSLGGSVLVQLAVEAEVSRLNAARVSPSATLRCKLGSLL